MTIGLGIDTSFDDTAIAVVRGGKEILANLTVSQFTDHQEFGGIVPERASRRHLEMLFPLAERALLTAGMGLMDIDYVAVAVEPGLVGSLLIGVTFAKSLALALDRPLTAVNHLKAHVYAGRMDHPDVPYPHLSLLISGANTLLIDVADEDDMTVIGGTIDDAVGECLDKTGRTLGLPLPAGPHLEVLAKTGDPKKIRLPRPMLSSGDFDFSFSGLKTAVLYMMRDRPDTSRADVAAALLSSASTVLVEKTMSAAKKLDRRSVVVVGGVAANLQIREAFAKRAKSDDIDVRFPSKALCTDNAAMIAGLGYVRYAKGIYSPIDQPVRANVSWKRAIPPRVQPPT